VLVLLFTVSASCEQYSNVASMFDLGMGARPLAMGNAFTGLADDGNALFYNPAGLAWANNLSVLSSYETRPSLATYGSVAATLSRFGVGINYFDFGEVPETDEFGNVVGSFSYRDYIIIAAAGLRASDVPLLSNIPMAENLAFGIGAKFLKVETLDPGSGSGFAIDLPFLFRSVLPSPRVPMITSYGFGIVIRNLIGLPIDYDSGHEESWPRELVIGASLEFLEQVILAIDVTNEKSFRLGIEWSPVSNLSLRAGLRNESVPMWSLGMGSRFRGFVFDFAVVFHPELTSQLRGSLEIAF
jgi:hypothetical protein